MSKPIKIHSKREQEWLDNEDRKLHDMKRWMKPESWENYKNSKLSFKGPNKALLEAIDDEGMRLDIEFQDDYVRNTAEYPTHMSWPYNHADDFFLFISDIKNLKVKIRCGQDARDHGATERVSEFAHKFLTGEHEDTPPRESYSDHPGYKKFKKEQKNRSE